MYAGRIVEKGSVLDIFNTPAHPYTIGLMLSIPRLDQLGKRLIPIDGTLPSLIDLPSTCAFLPRCRYAVTACTQELGSELRQVGNGHWTSCRLDIGKAEP